MSSLVVGKRFNPYRSFTKVSVIPIELMAYSGLSSSAKLLWARLAQYAGKDGRAYPSIATLAKALGLKERQVQNLLADLKKKGFIESSKGLRSNSYFFLLHHCLVDGLKQNIAHVDAKKCLSDTQKFAPKETKQENQIKETTTSKSGRRPIFSDLSEENRRYIELKTEYELGVGSIHTSPEAYKSGLAKKAREGALDASGLKYLEAWKRGERHSLGSNGKLDQATIDRIKNYLVHDKRSPKEICRLIQKQEIAGRNNTFWGLPLTEVSMVMRVLFSDYW